MTRYQQVSLYTGILILIIFIILSLAKQDITYFWPGLLPVFILLMITLFAKGGKE